jgi:hypothetical protein
MSSVSGHRWGAGFRQWVATLTIRKALFLLVEWGAAILGVLGSEVLAQKASYSAWGWVIWILSNVLWIAFAIKRRAFGLLAMQIFYMGISIQGALNWLH